MSRNIFYVFTLILDDNNFEKFKVSTNSKLIFDDNICCNNLKKLSIDLKKYELEVKSVLSNERIQKIYSCNEKVANQMFAGDVLSRFAINYVFDISIKNLVYKTSKTGKPYLEKYKNIFFNLSHSKDIVMCAISNKPVGIDVQYMKKLNINSFIKRFFSEEEQRKVLSSKSQEQEFFRIWTKKESFIKYKGSKITDNIKNLDYKFCNFTHFVLLDNYQVCICKEDEN